MLIIRLMGGLGNQMFQYAFYKKKQKQGEEVYCEKNLLLNDKLRKYEINLFENTRVNFIDNELFNEIYNRYVNRNIFEKVFNKLFPGTKKYYRENQKIKIDKNLLVPRTGIIEGYFQNEKYFEGIEDELKRDFKFPKGEEKLVDLLKKFDNNKNTVSIHIRRGDYLNYSDIYGNICTTEYYENAINKIKEYVTPEFIVFSDDIEWVKNNYDFKNAFYFEESLFDDYKDWYDMCAMSHCHYNIIANSTFSWWGAWLNSNKDKIVISPERFDNLFPNRGIVCDNWITVSSN